MSTVIFADRDGSAFGELGTRIVPALLPLQGVPALEHMLEALVRAGSRTALVVVGPSAREVKKRFGRGIRWGIALEYLEREEGEKPADVLKRLEPRLAGDTFVVRGDVGNHALVGPFFRQAEDRGEPVVAGVSGGRLAGLWFVRHDELKKVELPVEPSSPEWAVGEGHGAVELEGDPLLLDSIASYRKADRAAKAALSERAWVDKKAVLGPGTTVAEEAVVLRGAKLTEVSVLPRTVIPPYLELENAIVSGNLVVEAGTGRTSWLSDRLPPAPANRPSGASGRGLALLLFLLTLPLWPFAFLWALVANAGAATRPVPLNGCGTGSRAADGTLPRRAYGAVQLETAIAVFRDLPLLLDVLKGRLSLVGVPPLPPAKEAQLAEGWERARLEAPPGLLALSKLVVPAGSPAEVARLVDSFQARLEGKAGVLSLAQSNVFSAQAWTRPKEWNPDTLKEEG